MGKYQVCKKCELNTELLYWVFTGCSECAKKYSSNYCVNCGTKLV